MCEVSLKVKTFEKKVDRDIDQTKQDFTSLSENNVAGLAKIKTDLVTLGEDGITGLNRKFEQLAGDTKEMVTDTLKTLNKDVGHGLSTYNAKVQDVADRFPGGFTEICPIQKTPPGSRTAEGAALDR